MKNEERIACRWAQVLEEGSDQWVWLGYDGQCVRMGLSKLLYNYVEKHVILRILCHCNIYSLKHNSCYRQFPKNSLCIQIDGQAWTQGGLVLEFISGLKSFFSAYIV